MSLRSTERHLERAPVTNYLVSIATVICIQSLLTLSLNFQFGITGIVNCGQVAFFALGSYASAILTTAGYPAALGIVVGVLVAIAAGGVIGLSTLRLREDYFAIMTLGFAEVLRMFARNLGVLTNGPSGIAGIPKLFSLSGSYYPVEFLALVLVALLIAFGACSVLAASPLGRTLRAVRDDESAAMAIGKNPLQFRLLALVWGASLAAIAGSLWAHYVSYVVPDQFTSDATFYVWMAMMIGGRGSMVGSVAGTVVLFTLLEGSRFLNDMNVHIDASQLASLRQILIGLGLIALIKLERNRSRRLGRL
jgi:branched-chain amino acid transport system permease protein